MRESAADLQALQDLLDRSYGSAGPHLLSIHRAERRLSAERLVARLQGMCLLVLATVTADGRPLTGPVDGVFFRGAFHFGSSPQSFRYRHIRQRPRVSATHLPSEQLAVTVHGQASFVDVRVAENAELRQTLLDIYTPRYGSEWDKFLDSVGEYVRIDAQRMFAFYASELSSG